MSERADSLEKNTANDFVKKMPDTFFILCRVLLVLNLWSVCGSILQDEDVLKAIDHMSAYRLPGTSTTYFQIPVLFDNTTIYCASIERGPIYCSEPSSVAYFPYEYDSLGIAEVNFVQYNNVIDAENMRIVSVDKLAYFVTTAGEGKLISPEFSVDITSPRFGELSPRQLHFEITAQPALYDKLQFTSSMVNDEVPSSTRSIKTMDDSMCPGSYFHSFTPLRTSEFNSNNNVQHNTQDATTTTQPRVQGFTKYGYTEVVLTEDEIMSIRRFNKVNIRGGNSDNSSYNSSDNRSGDRNDNNNDTDYSITQLRECKRMERVVAINESSSSLSSSSGSSGGGNGSNNDTDKYNTNTHTPPGGIFTSLYQRIFSTAATNSARTTTAVDGAVLSSPASFTHTNIQPQQHNQHQHQHNTPSNICILSAIKQDGQRTIWLQQAEHMNSSKFNFIFYLDFDVNLALERELYELAVREQEGGGSSDNSNGRSGSLQSEPTINGENKSNSQPAIPNGRYNKHLHTVYAALRRLLDKKHLNIQEQINKLIHTTRTHSALYNKLASKLLQHGTLYDRADNIKIVSSVILEAKAEMLQQKPVIVNMDKDSSHSDNISYGLSAAEVYDGTMVSIYK